MSVFVQNFAPKRGFQLPRMTCRLSNVLGIRTFLLLFFCTILVYKVSAQGVSAPPAFVYITTIDIEGNRKTRANLILRELEFSAGDSISVDHLGTTLERNSLRLMNLGIFATAAINILSWDERNRVTLQIRLQEGWYIYPAPLFELADRNFNVWWKEFGHSLRRVNYGIDLNWLNFSGQADLLKTKLQFGYSNKYELAYRHPNVNKKQTLGLQTAIAFSRNHEIAYKTDGNKILFHTDPNRWMIKRFAFGAGLTWRPKLFVSHTFNGEYHHNRINDTIAEMNPDFFLQRRTVQQYVSLTYNFSVDRLDIRPYPLSGWRATFEIRQNGFLPAEDLHLTRLYAEYDRYFKLTPKLSLALQSAGRLSLPRCQPPYYNNQGLGYGNNFVRGYEYYVADGLDFAIIKTGFHLEIFNRTYNLGKFMPVTAFKTFPLKVYLAFNNDVGYSNDPFYGQNNPFVNRAMYGYGLGLDIVAYYNKIARFEWSRNDLGQSGFFVRINAGF